MCALTVPPRSELTAGNSQRCRPAQTPKDAGVLFSPSVVAGTIKVLPQRDKKITQAGTGRLLRAVLENPDLPLNKPKPLRTSLLSDAPPADPLACIKSQTVKHGRPHASKLAPTQGKEKPINSETVRAVHNAKKVGGLIYLPPRPKRHPPFPPHERNTHPPPPAPTLIQPPCAPVYKKKHLTQRHTHTSKPGRTASLKARTRKRTRT